MTNEERIEKNRIEIDRLLESDLPIDMIYARIRMLSDQNKQLQDSGSHSVK